MFKIPAGGVSTPHLYSMREVTSNPLSVRQLEFSGERGLELTRK